MEFLRNRLKYRRNRNAVNFIVFCMICVAILTKLISLVRLETSHTSEVPWAFRKSIILPSMLHSRRRSFCPPFKILKSDHVNIWGDYPAEKRFLSIGISTVHRKGGGYLVQTIHNLLENSDELTRKNTYLIVLLADIDISDKFHTSHSIATHFREEIDEGFLHVIQTYEHFYPPLNDIKSKYGDSKMRTMWRSKQNVDYAFVMCYCEYISNFYLHIEDDVATSPKYIYKLRDFISRQTEPWVVIDASSEGHVGKMYYSRDLGNVASYLLLMYDEMPVDWLIPYWINIHGESRAFPASLFKHIGLTSSLSEKTVNASDRFFDQYDHKYSGLNPKADVITSLASHEGEPHDAYNRGLGYFWSKKVEIGDFVLIFLRTATKIKQIFIDTGSNLALEDVVQGANLEASFVEQTVEKDRARLCVQFEKIGTFHAGFVNVSVIDERKINCIRLLVTAEQENWIFLREINIWPQ